MPLHDNVMRLNILPRGTMRYYTPPTPAYWNLSKLNRKWYWRALDWFLKKVGGEYRDIEPESWPVRQIEIDHSSIVKLLETSSSAMQYLWDKKATTLVLGYDEMAKLKDEMPTEMMRFNMPFRMANQERSPYGLDYQIVTRMVDLKIVLVPWLSGWALLPDLDDGKTSIL